MSFALATPGSSVIVMTGTNCSKLFSKRGDEKTEPVKDQRTIISEDTYENNNRKVFCFSIAPLLFLVSFFPTLSVQVSQRFDYFILRP